VLRIGWIDPGNGSDQVEKCEAADADPERRGLQQPASDDMSGDVVAARE